MMGFEPSIARATGDYTPTLMVITGLATLNTAALYLLGSIKEWPEFFVLAIGTRLLMGTGLAVLSIQGLAPATLHRRCRLGMAWRTSHRRGACLGCAQASPPCSDVMKPATAAARPFHPDLRNAARWWPRGLGRAWIVKLLRMLPVPKAKLPEGISIEERRIGGAASVSIRIVAPVGKTGPRPAVLWVHGGGYVTGSAKQDDRICAHIAHRLQVTVISVDYRLAPEHPFPAALDDCYAAFEFIHAQASSLHIDPLRIAVAGQSAGGGLAASLVQAIRDRGARMPVLQMLMYPMLDDRTVLRTVDDTNHRLWDSSSNRFGWTSYLAMPPGASSVPDYAAPSRRADLTGLAPAWIGLGTHDLFHDEDVAYARRLEDWGVDVQLEIVDGAFHGFDAAFPNAPVSQQFVERQMAAMARAFRIPLPSALA